jgi:hypothetical protein
MVEPRGSLLPFDFAPLPFSPRRAFVVRHVPPGTTRGGHARRASPQLRVLLSGTIALEVRRAGAADPITQDDSCTGRLIPPGVWSSRTCLTADAALLVLSDEPCDPSGYLT